MNPFPRFEGYDGHFVSPRLALGSCPQPKHVEAIAAAGVRGILNLVAVCEARSMAYVHHLPPGIYWLHLAFWDGWLGVGRPGYCERLSAGYAEQVVRHAAAVLRDRSPVLIHCMGGIGRAGNLATILLAASEGLTPEAANARIRQVRDVSPYARDGFWKEAGGDAVVEIAREVLAQPPQIPQNVSAFLASGWQLATPAMACAVSAAPCVGLHQDAGWRPLPANSEFVDVHEQCPPDGIVYLARRVHVAEPGEWILHVGHDGGARIFVDRRPVACDVSAVNPAPYLRSQARVEWASGEHEIVVALDRAGGRGWGIHVCFEPTEAMQVLGRTCVFPR